MGGDNFDYVAAALRDPLTVRAMLEDYRAGLSIDADHDREDRRSGRTIRCPVLVAWSARDDMVQLHGDLASIWSPWVTGTITTAAIDSGHHMAEENPQQLAEVLAEFLVSAAPSTAATVDGRRSG
jgi:haloacetate dehalogenase